MKTGDLTMVYSAVAVLSVLLLSGCLLWEKKREVSSRDELMLYIELFRCCDRLDELTAIA